MEERGRTISADGKRKHASTWFEPDITTNVNLKLSASTVLQATSSITKAAGLEKSKIKHRTNSPSLPFSEAATTAGPSASQTENQSIFKLHPSSSFKANAENSLTYFSEQKRSGLEERGRTLSADGTLNPTSGHSRFFSSQELTKGVTKDHGVDKKSFTEERERTTSSNVTPGQDKTTTSHGTVLDKSFAALVSSLVQPSLKSFDGSFPSLQMNTVKMKSSPLQNENSPSAVEINSAKSASVFAGPSSVSKTLPLYPNSLETALSDMPISVENTKAMVAPNWTEMPETKYIQQTIKNLSATRSQVAEESSRETIITGKPQEISKTATSTGTKRPYLDEVSSVPKSHPSHMASLESTLQTYVSAGNAVVRTATEMPEKTREIQKTVEQSSTNYADSKGVRESLNKGMFTKKQAHEITETTFLRKTPATGTISSSYKKISKTQTSITAALSFTLCTKAGPFYPHPKDCSKYIRCTGANLWKVKSCAAGTVFNPVTKLCEHGA